MAIKTLLTHGIMEPELPRPVVASRANSQGPDLLGGVLLVKSLLLVAS